MTTPPMPNRFKQPLILKHASASSTSGEWRDDDFDVLADGEVVGRIQPFVPAYFCSDGQRAPLVRFPRGAQ